MKGAYEHALQNVAHLLMENGAALLHLLDESSGDACEGLSDEKLGEIMEMAFSLKVICTDVLSRLDGIGHLRETDGGDSEF